MAEKKITKRKAGSKDSGQAAARASGAASRGKQGSSRGKQGSSRGKQGRSRQAAAEAAPARTRTPAKRSEEVEGASRPSVEEGARSATSAEQRSPAPRRDGSLTGKYVYCIIQSTEPMSFGSMGIGAEPMEVYTIGYQDIAAVVSDTPLEVYDPTRENVLSHESVNERVMHEFTVIPMSFGTVFKTADDIVELLRSAYPAFRDVLQKMENKLEFGLKVLWDPEQIIQVIEKDDEGLRRLREEILKQRGSTYFARMQYGRLVDSLLEERSVFYVGDIFEGLRSVSVASRVNKPIGERMIMNAAFLVSRDKEADFDAAVKEIGGRYPHLTFKYTGPWPPYNFVNIRLKLERAEDAG